MSVVSDVIFTKCTDELLFPSEDRKVVISSINLLNLGISKLYEIKLNISSSKIDSKLKNYFFIKEEDMPNLRGKTVQFYFKFDDNSKTLYSGIITDISLLFHSEKSHYEYEITLMPALYLLTQSYHNRAWIEKDTDEIIEAIFKEYNLYIEFSKSKNIDRTGQNLESKRIRTNTVQYNESDYDFLCRLLQEEGLNYIIEQKDIVEDRNDLKSCQRVLFIYDLKTYFNKTNANKVKEIFHHEYDYKHSIKLNNFKISSSFIDQRKYKYVYKALHDEKNTPLFNILKNPNINNSKLVNNEDKLDSYLKFYNTIELYRKKTFTDIVTGSNYKNNLKVGEKIKFSILNPNNIIKNDLLHFISSLNINYKRESTVGNSITSNEFKINFNAYPETTFFMSEYDIPEKTTRSAIAYVYGDKNQNIKIIKGIENEGSNNPGTLLGIHFFWQTTSENEEDGTTPFIWARVKQIKASDGSGAYFEHQYGDEVHIDFLNDDIDQPSVVGAYHNSKNKPPKSADTDSKKGEKINEQGLYLGKNEKLALKTSEDIKDENKMNSTFIISNNVVKASTKDNEKETLSEIKLLNTGDTNLNVTKNISVLSAKGNISTETSEGNVSTISKKGNISTEAKSGNITNKASSLIKSNAETIENNSVQIK